jgi:hypothetical protein
MGSCGSAALSAETERVELSSDLDSKDSPTACSAALVRRHRMGCWKLIAIRGGQHAGRPKSRWPSQ